MSYIERLAQNRSLKVIAFTRSEAFEKNLILAAISSIPRWFLAQTLESDKLDTKDGSAPTKSIVFSRRPAFWIAH